MTMDITPSSPPSGGWNNMEEELAYYKAQYETLEAELQEFQNSSKELEAELERDVEESEKRERKLQEKAERLGFEAEEWKVCSFSAKNALQRANLNHRPSTSKAKSRRTMRRTHCRRRLQHFGMVSGHFSSDCATSRYRATILSDRREIKLLR